MSSELSRARPVETILSGPAASVLAGKSFCDSQDYIIVDMGGTTTDISVVRGGKPVTAAGGIQIGGWKTTVKGVLVSPFALGGDTTVRLEDEKLKLFPRRATPMCIAAQRWPEITDMLSGLLDKGRVNKFPLHEIFYLIREPAEQKSYDEYERTLIESLRRGPCILDKLQEEMGIDLYHFDSERLESEGVVIRAGLTPTDFMHLKSDYAEYDKNASELAARYLLCAMNKPDTPEELHALVDEVYELVEGKMFENLLRVMLERQHPAAFKNGVDTQTEYLIREAWSKRHSDEASILTHAFGTKSALVGIGAPTHVFLPAVAEALGAPCILPEHAEVANALGALKAEINVKVRVDISQYRNSETGDLYYIAHMPSGSQRFESLDEAIDAAKPSAEEAAIKEAEARGAIGQLTTDTRVEWQDTISGEGKDIKLGYMVVSEVTVGLG